MGITQKQKPNKDKLKLSDVIIGVKNNGIDTAEFKNNIAKNIPVVYYYGVQLQQNNIKKLIVDNNKFLPLVYITYVDANNIISDIGFPTDNAKLTVVLPSNHESLANIFMEFKVQKFTVDLMKNSAIKVIHMWGVCNVENLLISEYKTYNQKTSFELMKETAGDAGLGFMSNVDSSSDAMTWLNPSMNKQEFLQDVTNKAWVGESGFVWSFVDLFYNLNYINVEASLSQPLTEIHWINTNIFNNANIGNTVNSEITRPYLTNEASQRGSNIFFSGEQILNQSTDISLKRGYIRNAYFYDIDGNWGDKAGSYKIYGLDTITSTGTNNNAIYLKGEPGGTDFYNKNNKNYYLDKIDTKNMYADFLWAKLQNSENILDLQKIAMQITLPVPNFNIRRYEKLKLVFFNSNQGLTNNATNIKLNGEWLVTGISFEWNGGALYQKVNIVKRELTVNEL